MTGKKKKVTRTEEEMNVPYIRFLLELLSVHGATEPIVMGPDDRHTIDNIVTSVPINTEVDIIVLRFGFSTGRQMSFREIGKSLGISGSLAESRFVRGMIRIRRLYGSSQSLNSWTLRHLCYNLLLEDCQKLRREVEELEVIRGLAEKWGIGSVRLDKALKGRPNFDALSLSWSTRVHNKLKENGIKTLGQLANMTAGEVFVVFGTAKAVQEVRKGLAAYGMRLKKRS